MKVNSLGTVLIYIQVLVRTKGFQTQVFAKEPSNQTVIVGEEVNYKWHKAQLGFRQASLKLLLWDFV